MYNKQQNGKPSGDLTKEMLHVPLVSVIIVNYNGFPYVDRCLKSVFSNKYANYEVIVVDNGSTDGSVSKLQTKFREMIKIIVLSMNWGPAKARNMGVAIAKGKYVGFLDNDTTVHPDWMAEAVEKFELDGSIGVIQCKILMMNDPSRIDYVGEFIGQNGFLVQPAHSNDIDAGQFERDYEILAAKSAGMFIRKSTFKKIGGFDDDYFMYVEETDLGWRSWLTGYKSVYDHKSVVYHEFGTSSLIVGKDRSDYNVKFHGTKNYVLTLYKNLGSKEMMRILPEHVGLWIGLSYYELLNKRWRSFLLVNKALLWNILNYPRSRRKRTQIQDRRLINDQELFKRVMRSRNLSYFLDKTRSKKRAGNAESW